MLRNSKIKKVSIIFIAAVIIIMCMGLGIYKYNKVQTYKNLMNAANEAMYSEKYDQAKALFNQALSYKNDSLVQKDIKLATKLKSIKNIYDEGTKLMNNKKYLDAIYKFNKIPNDTDKLYTNAQKNIDKCKKQYIVQELNNAEILACNNNCDEAIKHLDAILKVDGTNEDAKRLKKTYSSNIQLEKNKSAQSTEAQKETNQQNNIDSSFTPDQAVQLARQYYFKQSNEAPDDGIAGSFSKWENRDGKTYAWVHLYSVAAASNGGSGTVGNIGIAKDGSTITP